ncbi:DUF1707 SHOCT-like domain-containing protein [Saccharothrix variisporea]|uniref:Uncharacterized protein DUF1707 n=1 Tax=Saccharothrix variisporea TaxID=543527 RepID=A0A495XEC0_9PSEU|nr:DUF1707 domain-containing protein [Saccharothrix variisporea]RKT72357.1 uncharacterized protein DUF1707 [Saccharothrix variisporea]
MGERDIRIGDAERQRAIELLGEHLSEGRLDVDEYGDRTARVTAAKTRGELLALFADLPAPHPRFAQVAPLPSTAPPALPGQDRRWLQAAVPLVGLLTVALFFLVKNPFVFLLVPAVALIVGRMGNR